MASKLTAEEFIRRAILVHGDRYEWALRNGYRFLNYTCYDKWDWIEVDLNKKIRLWQKLSV